MAGVQKNVFPGKGWYGGGVQRLGADHMTGLIILDFRVKCWVFLFFVFPQSRFLKDWVEFWILTFGP